jgi:transcriptional regulator with XRE-family HTH domain
MGASQKEMIVMAKQTMGEIISNLRREKGMTQKDLADRMGVTDKAVSKWERNLSCPDISSIPRLAEALDTTVDTLMDVTPKNEAEPATEKVTDIVLKAVPLAMGIAVVVGSMLNKLEPMEAARLLGIGIFCLSLRAILAK